MEKQKPACFTRKIGATKYKVKVCFSEDAGETYEDKMIRLVADRLITVDDLYEAREAGPKGAA